MSKVRKSGQERRLLKPSRLFGAMAIALAIGSPLFVASQTMLWQSNFPAIELGAIAHQGDVIEGSSMATLFISGDVEISADNTTAARLSGPNGNILITEYKLTFDGNGASASGGATVDYTPHDSFLNPHVLVKHVFGDDAVDVTLYVKARNQAGNVADAGSYTAHQTLTATWVGP